MLKLKKTIQMVEVGKVYYPEPVASFYGSYSKVAKDLKSYFSTLDKKVLVIRPQSLINSKELNLEFRKNFIDSKVLVFSSDDLAEKAFKALPGSDATSTGEFGISDVMPAKRTAFQIFTLQGRGIEISEPPIHLAGYSSFKINQQGYATAG